MTDATIKSTFFLGLIDLHLGDFESSLKHFEFVTSMEPRAPNTFLGMAYATAAIGGEGAVEKAIELAQQASGKAAVAKVELPAAEAARLAWERQANGEGSGPGTQYAIGSIQDFFNQHIN
jgi:hypothetical protein